MITQMYNIIYDMQTEKNRKKPTTNNIINEYHHRSEMMAGGWTNYDKN